MRKFLIGWSLAGVGAVLGGALVFEAGCYSRDVCDGGGFVTYGSEPGQGTLATPDIWESGPQTGDWMPFPRKRNWIIHPKGLEGRGILRVTPYVSPDQNPAKQFTQFTTGAGNLTELRIDGDNIWVINDTCEDFFLRVVIEAYPAPPVAGPFPDAAPPPVVSDASPDAPIDAGPD
jgi:hypothetical protein